MRSQTMERFGDIRVLVPLQEIRLNNAWLIRW